MWGDDRGDGEGAEGDGGAVLWDKGGVDQAGWWGGEGETGGQDRGRGTAGVEEEDAGVVGGSV